MAKLTGVAIVGANGRMGETLLNACSDNNHIRIISAMVRAGNNNINNEILLANSKEDKPVIYSSQDDPFPEDIDVLIDFTLPKNTLHILKQCIKDDIAVVIGTTGFSREQQQQINEAAKKIPVLQASNTSVGVNITMALLKQAAKILGKNIPVEIMETHHIHKIDSPSGTAITMAKTIAHSTDRKLQESIVIDKNNPVHKPGHIYVNSIREGEVVGNHSVSFILEDEIIEISHRAADRKIFATGAARAAHWLAGKEPGMYSIDDVLDLI